MNAATTSTRTRPGAEAFCRAPERPQTWAARAPWDASSLARRVLRQFGMHTWRERCEDAAQEWYLIAIQRGELFDRNGGLDARAAHCLMMRVCGRQAQRGKRRHISLDSQPSFADGLEARGDERLPGSVAEQVVVAVESLEADLQNAILLRFYRDMGIRQIAAELDVPVAEVRRRIAAALEQLRADLEIALTTLM
ncbi:RNA polymerase sigma factor [Phycisphaerae bacterium RAS1]|nr:RNA polymerase sigma factor [Phycisphaerae bacterium RAS1]